MSKITLLNERSIAVEVEKEEDSFVSYYWIGTDNMLYANFGQIDYPLEVALPPGSWSILGRPEEMAEEKWHKIVDRFNNGACRDYKCPQFDPCDELLPMYLTPTESGLSLIASKGLTPESIIILIKQ